MKKMNCERVKDLIPMCIDNTASEDTIKEVERHTELCSDCRRFYNFCKNSQSRFSGRAWDVLSKPVKSKADNVDEAFAALSKKIKSRKNRRFAISAAVLFAAIFYAAIEIFKSSKQRKDI